MKGKINEKSSEAAVEHFIFTSFTLCIIIFFYRILSNTRRTFFRDFKALKLGCVLHSSASCIRIIYKKKTNEFSWYNNKVETIQVSYLLWRFPVMTGTYLYSKACLNINWYLGTYLNCEGRMMNNAIRNHLVYVNVLFYLLASDDDDDDNDD